MGVKKEDGKHASEITQERRLEEQNRHTGFIAQEVEKTANQLGYEFDAVHHPQTAKDPYTLSYAQFVMPLVKSVQELNTKIEEQQKLIKQQQELVNQLIKEVQVLKQK
jgi:hypothetical protein